MEVMVTARNCEVSDRFREHIRELLSRLEKHDHRIIRVHAEVEPETNPRQGGTVHVELTAVSKGPVIRAEAHGETKWAALDAAVDKMAAQMRRAADRRRVHRGRRSPVSVGRALAETDLETSTSPDQERVDAGLGGSSVIAADGPMVVREKVHQAPAMTLDQALYEMELVGHDFYLFADADHQNRPAVVYRRKGYDYGVIGLDLARAAG
ncbi:MAG: ribosome hibernation-promoting factor, HPF/YfiA family [Nocardioides sp.]